MYLATVLKYILHATVMQPACKRYLHVKIVAVQAQNRFKLFFYIMCPIHDTRSKKQYSEQIYHKVNKQNVGRIAIAFVEVVFNTIIYEGCV